MEQKNRISKQIGAACLVAGTCIGGGMLALPIDTAKMGFFPSVVALLFGWLFMTLTGLLVIEANLWIRDKSAHLVTMATELLGQKSRYLVILLYLFMGYASLIAYNAAGAPLLARFFLISGYEVSPNMAIFLFVLIFGSLFYFKENFLSNVNTFLVCGMIFAYIWIMFIGLKEVQIDLLSEHHFAELPFSLPLILTTFSFQMMAPSLVPYLNHQRGDLRRAILFGTLIPLCAYLLWQFVVFGVVPLYGKKGLLFAYEEGIPATEVLSYHAKTPILAPLSSIFAFFSLVTSFIGIGFGLFGFLADLTGWKKKGLERSFLVTLVLVPTLVVTLVYPKVFLLALDVTGGFGDTLLSALIPIAMVISGRYFLQKKDQSSWFEGKISLAILSVISIAIFFIQCIKLT